MTDENETRRCAQGGLLVNGDTRLLTDPSEYYHYGTRVQVGCSRMRCTRCQSMVRCGPPGLGLKDGVKWDLRATYEAADWSTLPWIEERYALFSRWRMYVCACTYSQTDSNEPIENDYESRDDPTVPWTCDGHPVPALPIALTDFTIDDKTDASELVTKILNGSCPRPLERPDALGPEPALWLAWLYVYLRGLPLADQISSAIADRVTDPDPQTVGRVLFFFSTFPKAIGIEKVVALAEADPHRVALGYSIPESEYRVPSLWEVLVAAVRGELRARIESLIDRVLFIPLASLPHDDRGPTSILDFERQRRTRLRWDAATVDWFLQDFARSRARERTDVVAHALSETLAFEDKQRRVFIADRILEIEAAVPGRWRAVMKHLTDQRYKPEQEHLIVTAAARLIEAGVTNADEFRAWIQERRAYGWVRDSWVLPIETMLKEATLWRCDDRQITLEEVLALPGRKVQICEEEKNGTSSAMIYSVGSGGAKQLAWRKVPTRQAAAMVADLKTRGCEIAKMDPDANNAFVWVCKADGGIEVFDGDRKVFDATGERATLESGRTIARADFATVFAFANGYKYRGVKATLPSGEEVTLVAEASATALYDFTYSRNELLWETSWCNWIAIAIADWAGASYENLI